MGSRYELNHLGCNKDKRMSKSSSQKGWFRVIFYYSATGNSLWAATKIAAVQNDKVINIAEEMKNEGNLLYHLEDNETVGFVYPVHAWRPPERILKFIKEMRLENYHKQYIYTIAVCAESAGNTTKVIKKALDKKEMTLSSSWEMVLPNNYIVAIDVDSPEIVKQDFEKAEELLIRINEKITNRQEDHTHIPCSMGVFRTNIIGSLFNTFGKGTGAFYATDACISCGLCQKICPSSAIKMQDGKPNWQGTCDNCLACINRCPKSAIQHGKGTLTRGRYQNPILKSKKNSIID